METVASYQSERIAEGFWRIVDPRGCCIYLIAGSRRALAIDTGMWKEPLFPFLKTLTKLPMELALTHAHIDHMYHAEEFERVYVSRAEQEGYTKRSQWLMDIGAAVFRVKRKKYRVDGYKAFEYGDSMDLGGVHVKCLAAPGHTRGSALFVDETHRAVICGDAVGSGSGVWMFLPDCTSVREYRDSLGGALEKLRPYQDYAYFGGHDEREADGTIRPLSYATFEDMHALCERIINGTAAPERLSKFPIRILYGCRYKTAAMATRTGKLK